MIGELTHNGIVLHEAEHFSARDILTCGQVFRYYDNGTYYSVISLDKRCDIIEDGDVIRLETASPEYFARYFDLDTSYTDIIASLRGLPLMDEAVEHGKGIRILRQDRCETIIDFIISANNHIPRIKGIIERICESLGERCEGYYAFPTIEALASVGSDFYAKIGAGYRASYLHDTANMLLDGFDIDAVNGMESDKANKTLCTLKGVGPKVADCILLFGYHRMDTFPVDTWIKKVYADIFHTSDVCNAQIRRQLIDTYGTLSGYAQQYLFYNKRG